MTEYSPRHQTVILPDGTNFQMDIITHGDDAGKWLIREDTTGWEEARILEDPRKKKGCFLPSIIGIGFLSGALFYFISQIKL